MAKSKEPSKDDVLSRINAQLGNKQELVDYKKYQKEQSVKDQVLSKIDNVLANKEELTKNKKEEFDPEGSGYDYDTAEKYGIKPDETGHYPSRDPKTGLILKGKSHPTFSKTVEGEEKEGYEIYKGPDNRYYSRKKEPANVLPEAKVTAKRLPMDQKTREQLMTQEYNQYFGEGKGTGPYSIGGSPEEIQRQEFAKNLAGVTTLPQDYALLGYKNVVENIKRAGKNLVEGLGQVGEKVPPSYGKNIPKEYANKDFEKNISDVLRGTGKTALGALEMGMNVMPGVIGLNVAQPLLQDVGGATAEKLGYKKEDGQKIANMLAPLVFGKKVAIGMLASHLTDWASDPVLEKIGLKDADKELAKNILSNAAFFLAPAAVEKVPKYINEKLTESVNKGIEESVPGMFQKVQGSPLDVTQRVMPENLTPRQKKVFSAYENMEGRTPEEKSMIESMTGEFAPTLGEMMGEKTVTEKPASVLSKTKNGEPFNIQEELRTGQEREIQPPAEIRKGQNINQRISPEEAKKEVISQIDEKISNEKKRIAGIEKKKQEKIQYKSDLNNYNELNRQYKNAQRKRMLIDPDEFKRLSETITNPDLKKKLEERQNLILQRNKKLQENNQFTLENLSSRKFGTRDINKLPNENQQELLNEYNNMKKQGIADFGEKFETFIPTLKGETTDARTIRRDQEITPETTPGLVGGIDQETRSNDLQRLAGGEIEPGRSAVRGEEIESQRKIREIQQEEINTSPTEAQKEAGNYKKGHLKLDGMDLSIENPKGSIRSGKDTEGNEWKTELKNTYGYIKGTISKDKDHIDAFLNDDNYQENSPVFIVNQTDPKGKFDEHKVMLGFPDKETAIKSYESNYQKGRAHYSDVVQMPMDEFKEWSKDQSKTKFPAKESAETNEPATTPAKLPETPVPATIEGKEDITIPPKEPDIDLFKQNLEKSGVNADFKGINNGRNKTPKSVTIDLMVDPENPNPASRKTSLTFNLNEFTPENIKSQSEAKIKEFQKVPETKEEKVLSEKEYNDKIKKQSEEEKLPIGIYPKYEDYLAGNEKVVAKKPIVEKEKLSEKEIQSEIEKITNEFNGRFLISKDEKGFFHAEDQAGGSVVRTGLVNNPNDLRKELAGFAKRNPEKIYGLTKEVKKLTEEEFTADRIKSDILSKITDKQRKILEKKLGPLEDLSSQELINVTKKIETKEVPETITPEVKNIPISSIKTDENRFQNRALTYSPRTVKAIEENYNPNKFDPIVLWNDPVTNQDYVISGHSRLEGMKRRNAEKIPARYFKGTEDDAIEFARIEANRSASAEDLLEDIKAFKLAKEKKYNKKQLEETFPNGQYKALEDLSNLNPKGQFLSNLNSEGKISFPYLERNARWVGQMRSEFPQLTDTHEQELFDYFYREREKHLKVQKDDVFNAVRKQVNRGDFSPDQALMLDAAIKSTGVRARADTRDIQAKIDELIDRKNEAITQKEKDAIDSKVARLREDIQEIVSTQTSLFEDREKYGVDKILGKEEGGTEQPSEISKQNVYEQYPELQEKKFSEQVDFLKKKNLSDEMLGRFVSQLREPKIETSNLKTQIKTNDKLQSIYDKYERGEIDTSEGFIDAIRKIKDEKIQEAIRKYDEASHSDKFEFGKRSGLPEDAIDEVLTVVKDVLSSKASQIKTKGVSEAPEFYGREGADELTKLSDYKKHLELSIPELEKKWFAFHDMEYNAKDSEMRIINGLDYSRTKEVKKLQNQYEFYGDAPAMRLIGAKLELFKTQEAIKKLSRLKKKEPGLKGQQDMFGGPQAEEIPEEKIEPIKTIKLKVDPSELSLFETQERVSRNSQEIKQIFGTVENQARTKLAISKILDSSKLEFKPEIEPGMRIPKRLIAKEWKKTGYVNYSGVKIDTIHDIADLFYIYRDPKTETFHLIGRDANNVIVMNSAISSGASNYVNLTNTEQIMTIAETMKERGAVKVTMLHNHPSGDPKPSQDDVSLSYWLRKKLLEKEIDLDSSIVINGDEFTSWIVGDSKEIDVDYYKYLDPLTHPQEKFYKEFDAYPKIKLNHPDMSAMYFSQLKYGNGNVAIVLCDSKLRVHGYEYVNKNMLDNADEFGKYIDNILESHGAASFFIAGYLDDISPRPALKAMADDYGIFTPLEQKELKSTHAREPFVSTIMYKGGGSIQIYQFKNVQTPKEGKVVFEDKEQYGIFPEIPVEEKTPGKEIENPILEKEESAGIIKRFFDGINKSIGKSPNEIQQAKDAMYEHHKLIRDASFVARKMKIDFDVKAKGMSEERKLLLINAFQQPEKYFRDLNPEEKNIYEFFDRQRKTIQNYALRSGVLDPETVENNPNYLFQWWMDEKSGKPYSPMYGQFSKSAPQLKKRVYATYEEGLKAGKKMATTNLGELIGLGLQGVTRAAETRNMFRTLSTIEISDENEFYRTSRSKEAKPLRMIETWSELKKQNKADGYTRYDHPALDKPIYIRSNNGQSMIIQGPVGIKNELFPFVKAYFETPSYGSLSRLMFAFKTLKLMGGFHIFSLNFQALAGSPGTSRIPVLNVVKGLKQIKEMGDDLRILHRNGLEIKDYADTGNFSNLLLSMKQSKNRAIRYAGIVLNAASDFTFNVVHPGIKANTAIQVYNDLLSKQEKKTGETLSEKEKDELAKRAVNYTDRLFSGEDYKAQVLQTNDWMAKYWYSPEARRKWQMTLLSPTWQKEHLGMLKDVIKSVSVDINKPESYLYRRYLYGALSIYAISNLYNWIVTKYMDGEGKTMMENESSFTVRCPWNKEDGTAVYMHPLKSIFEIPELLSDPIGKVINKLSPPVRTAAEAYKDIKEKDKEGLTAKEILNISAEAAQNIGVPISGTQIAKGNEPWQSQVTSIIGMPAYGERKEDSEEIKAIKEQVRTVNKLRKETLDTEGKTRIETTTAANEYRKALNKLDQMRRKSSEYNKEKYSKTREQEMNKSILGE